MLHVQMVSLTNCIGMLGAPQMFLEGKESEVKVKIASTRFVMQNFQISLNYSIFSAKDFFLGSITPGM